MKRQYIINKSNLLVIIWIAFTVISCTKDNESNDGNPIFHKISPIDQPELEITSGEMGDWIALHGEFIKSTKSIFFNDVAIDIQDTYYEDDKLYLQIPVKMPTKIDNKGKIITEQGEINFDFVVQIPQMELTGMFNEYTIPGDTLTIYGKYFNLYEVDSSNSKISFNGIENPVLKTGDNFITVKVPIDVKKNIKPVLINNKFNVEVESSVYFHDLNNIITNFDDKVYTGLDGAAYVGLWDSPMPISNNYSLLDVGEEGSGWSYLIGTGYEYTDDMKDNPGSYELKFELNMIKPIMNTKFFIYNYWNHPPAEITASDLIVQSLGKWQTISIPLEKIIPIDFAGDKSYIGSFNIRIDSPAGEPVKIGWDNFRIYHK